MEWSALVYVVLAAAVVALGLCVENKEYVQAAVEGGRAFGCRPTERRQARNRILPFDRSVSLQDRCGQ